MPFGLGRLIPMDWSFGGIYLRIRFNTYAAQAHREGPHRCSFCASVTRLSAAAAIRSLLRQHGIRSEQAASGREALEFLRLYDYDLVLMDLQLPDVPAYEVVRMMRAASLKMPVVILSDTATVQAKVKALDQGADDFLITPCDAEEMHGADPRRRPSQPGPHQFHARARTGRTAAGSSRCARARPVAASVAAGICRAGIAVPEAGRDPEQGRIPDAPLLRHGRARDEDDRRDHLPASQEAGDRRRALADRYGLGLWLHPAGSVA